MADPGVKREAPIERPLSVIPSKCEETFVTQRASQASRPSSNDMAKDNPLKLLLGPVSSDVLHTPHKQPLTRVKRESTNQDQAIDTLPEPAPATPRGGQPRGCEAESVSGATACANAQGLSVQSRLSSRQISALTKQQQPVASIKLSSGRQVSPSSSISRLSQVSVNRCTPLASDKDVPRTRNMEGFDFQSNNAASFSAGIEGNALDIYSGAHDQMCDTVTITGADYQLQQDYLQELRNAKVTNQLQLQRQHDAISELVNSNRDLHLNIRMLDARILQLEREVAYFGTLSAQNISAGPGPGPYPATSQRGMPDGDIERPLAKSHSRALTKSSSKRPITDDSAAEGGPKPDRKKSRKKLEVQIPGKATGQAVGVGLPTPMPSALQTASSSGAVFSLPTTPRTPYTPGRIGPPESYKKTTTSINKRDIHNLNKSIPPTNVQLPMVPLTDTEVIVYFFNSLSRPIVSLRLYARGWGPASIVQALNDHRQIEPPYLRNTCSVKCTTAIKHGKRLYGEEWEVENRAALSEAEDCKATDLIRADENETVDYYVRALGVSLRKHPTDTEGGIFTACVKYCIENQAPYTMSNVYKLAIDLQDGIVPQHPASPAASDVAPPPLPLSRFHEVDIEDDFSEYEGCDSASPSAGRKRIRKQSSGLSGSAVVNTVVNTHQDEDNE